MEGILTAGQINNIFGKVGSEHAPFFGEGEASRVTLGGIVRGWILALLAGQIHYDPSRVFSRWVAGKHPDNRRFKVIYSPARKARPQDDPPLEPCFMDDTANRIGVFRTLAVRANDFPIDALALLLFPLVHRESLEAQDLVGALAFSHRFPDYLVLHNMRGSSARRPDHLHFQAFLRDEFFPIETVPRQEFMTLDEARVSRLAHYPLYGLAVRGPNVVGVILTIVEHLHQQGTPYNLVVANEEVIVLPRTKVRAEGFPGLWFGGLESCGCMVLTDEAQYGALEAEDVWCALEQVGFGVEDQQGFEAALLDILPRRGESLP